MKEHEIRRLIQIVEESHIAELEVSRWGRKVRIRKYAAPPQAEPAPVSASPLGVQTPAAVPENRPETSSSETGLVPIVSPIVGTFYRAPAPNAKPFIELNDMVKPGQTVCLVEAMKLMNEIESEFNGRIARILVENGQPVEYNQPLFLVEPM
jgi:acetyl-CoA carboxylase biotin carboxyl carrier protein